PSSMPRPLPWKWIAIATSTSTALLALLLLPACCCVRGPAAPSTGQPPAIHIAPIGEQTVPDFRETHLKGPTETQMSNVWFHYDETMFLDIRSLRGQMISKPPGEPVNFDDRRK